MGVEGEMNYPVVIHKDEGSDYGVTVPDLPGCFSGGKTLEEAIDNAKEAILCHVEGIVNDGEALPEPAPIERHKENPEYADGLWAVVSVDLSDLSGKAKRVNITVPERFLIQFDSFARKKGETRSGLFVSAAMEYIARRKAG
jgi:predicted RNase H-like HicB family nuclease